MGARVGTSGWTYPHWKKTFFPGDLDPHERLHYYAQKFDTVEINTTFYGLPEKSTVRGWVDAVPKKFRFAVKASRFTTHNKKLLDPRTSTVRFFEAIEPLGGQVAAILFQLPPHWKFNGERLDDFLRKMPRGFRYAFEFRERSWLCEEAYRILEDHGAALCVYDFRGFVSPVRATAKLVYLRLHGPTAEAYRGSYPLRALRKWGREIAKWRAAKKEVLVYFDNDEKGYAPADALRLAGLLRGR